jgi:acetamidase/formamidase
MKYSLKPERRNLHGVLSKNIPPVLTIKDGDSVVFETIEPDWRTQRPDRPATDSGVFMERHFPFDAGHALCGPVFVEGAKPGMTLAVRVNNVIPGSWGWSRVGLGDPEHMDRMGVSGDELFLLWDIDAETGLCTSHNGFSVAASPFMGVMTVAPEGDADVRTHIPGSHGANMDCKDIVAGSVLYLPVIHEGAMFSTGDGHARQGDGELGGTAIECPIREANLSFQVVDEHIERPVCNSPRGWITFGFDADVTAACYTALKDMAALISRLHGVSYKEALALCSVAVDMHVTQLVNGVRGAHAVLPHGSFEIAK